MYGLILLVCYKYEIDYIPVLLTVS